MTTRRTFLTTSSLAAVAALHRQTRGGRSAWPLLSPITPGTLPRAADPQLKALALRALDAAAAAGASYAEVRFTITRQRTFHGLNRSLGMMLPPETVGVTGPTESETLAVGVRALAKHAGAWGFAAHSDWSPDRVAQLGRLAAEYAQAVAWPQVPPIEFVDHPPASTGHWVTPITGDPIEVSPEAIGDWVRQLKAAIQQAGFSPHSFLVRNLIFERQERTFASTAGAYTTQTIYTSLADVPAEDLCTQVLFATNLDPLPLTTPTGGGLEVLDAVLHRVPQYLHELAALAAPASGKMPREFKEFGEYDVVFDGAAMAALVNGTLGAALEYDRAVGYEANAGGTSYLAPPPKILGTSHASAGVTLTADRTLPGGCATVGWDDEGIAPQPFPLVKDGVVVDYASSREFVHELAPWYQRHGMPLRSNGCAAAENAATVPLVGRPNLVVQPAAQDTSLDALVSGVQDGLLFCGGELQTDFQQMSGRGDGVSVFTIKRGKIAESVGGAVYAFHRSADLWKNLVALGGASTAALRGFYTPKGQPEQVITNSVQAVAAHFSKVQVYNKKTL